MRLSRHEFQGYCSILMDLVSMPSVFTRPDDVKKVTSYCLQRLDKCLKGHQLIEDSEGNLICIPAFVDQSLPIVYLSAHADTVHADASEWTSPYAPFNPYEDEHEIVARGVSDCKAGVAFQLLLAQLIFEHKIALPNTIFTITFKEEGPGRKTSSNIAKKMGVEYPLSNQMTYLFALENTVSLAAEPILGYFTSERGNFTISMTGTMAVLKNYLESLVNWNPVAIWPHQTPSPLSKEAIHQTGGHVCTVGRKQNRLTEVILASENHDAITAGSLEEAFIIPTTIHVAKTEEPQLHTMILNQRSFASKVDILNELQGFPYQFLSDINLTSGWNIQKRFERDPLAEIFAQLNQRYIKLEQDFNPGASDASIIFNSLSKENQQRVLPLTVGPGTRSQRSRTPPRLTHGPNETFDKQSGMNACQTLLDLCLSLSK